MGRPIKLVVKEKLEEGAIGSGVFGGLGIVVTYLARHQEWVIQSGLFTAGAFAAAAGLYYLSTLLKPRKGRLITSTPVEDWSFRRR